MWCKVRIWLESLLHLFFPQRCAVCGTLLREGEEAICLHCNIDMPRTGYHLQEGNPVERLFWGKIPIERATSYFHYAKGSDFKQILWKFKYKNHRQLALQMGRLMAAELGNSSFFQEIDVLVPVPLHPHKRRQRGYNQSELLAKGISEVTGIPLDTVSLVRRKYTETQTRKSPYERWENVSGIFYLQHPDKLIGKHLLLIDDVLTTASTITACADALVDIEGVRISVLTLAVAGD
ncbi:MAG: ComF family protein [Mediterranea massiliensis]|nr:ComF family protein [Mediterranea massiliensis]